MKTSLRGLSYSLAAVGMLVTAGSAVADDAVVEGSASATVVAPTTTVETTTPVMATTETTETTTHVEMTTPSKKTAIGISVVAGVGGGGFTNRTMRYTTEAGGDYTARLSIGTRLPITFEGSYIGSTQYLDTFGLNNNAVLVGNGAQAALRFNLMPTKSFTPFIFGGGAWRHYKLHNVNQVNTSNVSADSDDVIEVPMGAGVALRSGGLSVDLRGEYRAAFKENLVSANGTDDGEHAPMNRWGATLNAGFEF